MKKKNTAPKAKTAATSLLIEGGPIACLGSGGKVLENHSLLIQDDRITRIAPSSVLKKELASGKWGRKKPRVISAAGKLVMPGLINAHMHFYSTLVRGLTKAAPSANFREVLDNLWWRLDRKLTLADVEVSATLPLIDAIRKGTTTLIDHHASPFAISGSLDRIAKAVRRTGLRASLCYEVSDRDGPAVAEEGIRENEGFLKSLARTQGNQLRGLFGLHASFTLSDKTLERAVSVARDLGAGMHVHTAEAASDQEACVFEHGCRVVERFHRLGVLGPKTICAHAVHVSEQEMALLAQTQTKVVHNPQSNLNNAVGIANVIELLRRGVTVGLGTDAMTVNMFEEVRVALWAQKLRQNHPSAAFGEMIGTLLLNNPRIAEEYWPGLGLGALAEGAVADMILVDYLPPTPMDASNFFGHFAFGLAQSQVDTTICNGTVLMQGKKLLLDLDEARLAAQSRALATKLWQRF